MDEKQRIDKWEAKIERIAKDYKHLTACCDAASDAGVLNTDGKLFDAIWKTHDGLLAMVDEFNWFEWYIYENECGAREMEAYLGGELSKITTPRQLAQLIVEDENKQN